MSEVTGREDESWDPFLHEHGSKAEAMGSLENQAWYRGLGLLVETMGDVGGREGLGRGRGGGGRGGGRGAEGDHESPLSVVVQHRAPPGVQVQCAVAVQVRSGPRNSECTAWQALEGPGASLFQGVSFPTVRLGGRRGLRTVQSEGGRRESGQACVLGGRNDLDVGCRRVEAVSGKSCSR